MRLTKFGHSCLLIEAANARLLLDPGVFSSGFEALTGLDGLLITHQHPDHLDRDRIGPLIAANPEAQVVADVASSAQLSEAALRARAVRHGDELTLGGVTVTVIGAEHAEIHPEVAVPPNVGYLIDGRFFYPGDAFTPPERPVEILGLPTAAPWMRIADAIEYLRAVKPQAAIPMHDGLLAHPEVFYRHFHRFAEEQDTHFDELANGPVTL